MWQSEGLNRKSTEIASNLGIDTGTVSRTLSLFRHTGSDFLTDVHFLDLISGQTYTLGKMRMRKLDCRLC